MPRQQVGDLLKPLAAQGLLTSHVDALIACSEVGDTSDSYAQDILAMLGPPVPSERRVGPTRVALSIHVQQGPPGPPA